ncbi:MAG: phosphoribosylanthranilate isomerase [Desulfovibrio sp.]|jgi:phosphoribosylanthranilate isomerase|nr:phosphoribosylanthranilate isomerase [Desulfovibrio sp.]
MLKHSLPDIPGKGKEDIRRDCLTGSLPAKVCGLTRASDVRLCLELDFRCIGFIFAPGSPRRISPEQAAAMPAGKAARVGVFAGLPAGEVRRIMETARLDLAQLHGDEDEAFCRAVGPERVIKVLWPQRFAAAHTEESGPVNLLYEECLRFAPVCAFFLLDAGLSGGGGGVTMSPESLRSFSPPRPWILAGGLAPDNLEHAFAVCSPWVADLNSGLEEAPGLKDETRIRAAAAALRGISITAGLPSL